MMGRRFALGFLVGLGLTCLTYAADPVFEAGFAQADITPTAPVALWGYDQESRPDFISDGVDDPLYAKAVVFKVGDDALAEVGMDLGRGPTPAMMKRIRAAVAEASGIDYVLISGSHTHHAPVIELQDVPGRGAGTYDNNVAYSKNLEKTLITLINEAAKNAQPARIGWATGQSTLNRNRHSHIEPKPVDRDVTVVAIETLDGKPIVHLVNFAAHPTTRPPQWHHISADYPGVMMRDVEQALNTHCVFIQGAAGDLQCDMNDAKWKEEAFSTPIGHALAKEVLALVPTIKPEVPETPSIAGLQHSFAFQTRIDFSSEAVLRMFSSAYFPEITACYAARLGDNIIRPQVNTVLVNGRLAFVGMSGEIFSAHAIRLKERARGMKVIFQGYCDGHDFYYPTIEAAAEGGYGADPSTNWAEIGAGELLADTALKDLYRLHGDLEPAQ